MGRAAAAEEEEGPQVGTRAEARIACADVGFLASNARGSTALMSLSSFSVLGFANGFLVLVFGFG